MGFQAPISIAKALTQIEEKKYLLPAIQREFVWEAEQTELLFDSILQDFPIGTFLLWEVNRSEQDKFIFYDFVRHYHERDKTHNEPVSVTGRESVLAVLDGQQRLTALLIGLHGTYASKLKWKRWDNDEAFPVCKLYLNLTRPAEAQGLKYDFRFFTSAQSDHGKRNHWFEVGRVLDFKTEDKIWKYLMDNELSDNDFARETLFLLHSRITKDKTITYFLEEDQTLEKVLNIFIRINSGGTELSYSDLLLSIATAQWESRDARKEIHDFVDSLNSVGDGFNFTKDFVLKSCFVLSDIRNIRFRVENFSKRNMKRIESQWPSITQALKLAAELASSFGYSRDTLTSHNSLIPLAYFIHTKGCPTNFVTSNKYRLDRKLIRQWLQASLLKGVFSGQADNVLRDARDAIKEDGGNFPVTAIEEKLRRRGKSLKFEQEEIEDLLDSWYGRGRTFSVLALLFPTFDFKNRFHIDHIHPSASCSYSVLKEAGVPEKDIQFCMDYWDSLPNLQLLEGISNQEKRDQPFKDWLLSDRTRKEQAEFQRRHLIPDVDFDLGNFKIFYEARRKRLEKELKRRLRTT